MAQLPVMPPSKRAMFDCCSCASGDHARYFCDRERDHGRERDELDRVDPAGPAPLRVSAGGPPTLRPGGLALWHLDDTRSALVASALAEMIRNGSGKPTSVGALEMGRREQPIFCHLVDLQSAPRCASAVEHIRPSGYARGRSGKERRT